MGKFGLITSALDKGFLTIAVIAMINSAIAIYYYLNVIRVAVFEAVEKSEAPMIGLGDASAVRGFDRGDRVFRRRRPGIGGNRRSL